MNLSLIFLVVALVAAAIGFNWALMERGRANRAEARAWELQDSASRLRLIEEQGGRNAALIQAEAARRGVLITLVVDFIHVLQYLWAASTALLRLA